MLACMVMCMFVSNREVLATETYGILTKNNCIELTSEEHEFVVLHIYKDGLYAIKTSGENDVVLNMVDRNDNEIVLNHKEHDNNYYETCYLKAGKYYVDVKVDRVDKDAVTKLWLFLLDDSETVIDKISSSINIEGEERYFSYIPDETDTYVIRSHGKVDLLACIYDEKGMLIDRSSSLTGNNFKIVDKLEKGKCYYIRVYSENDIGNFSIDVRKEKTFYSEVINLEVDDNLDRCFEGCIKEGCRESKVKFIPNVKGEFEFLVLSDMELKLDILDENQDSVATSIANNKSYSVVRASVNAGCEYTVKISGEQDLYGIYKLRILNFEKLRNDAETIVIGSNKSVLEGKEKYLKFRCPSDGCFNFELITSPGISISLYDENGRFVKQQKDCACVTRPTVGMISSKDDVLYVKVSSENETKEDIVVVVSDFGELMKKSSRVTEGEVSGSITEDTKAVLYQFIPPRDGVYTIKSTCKFYIDGKLYNDTGDLISENNEVDMKFRITRRMEREATYYIQVTDLYRDSAGDFSFSIEFVNEDEGVLLEEDIVVEDELEYVDDVKRYTFRVNSDDMYAINVESNGSMHVRLSDDKDVLIDKEVKNTGIKLSKEKEYKIEISSEDEMSDVVEYSLGVENFTKKVCNAKSIVSDKEYQGNLIMSDTKDNYVFVANDSACYSIYTTGDLDTYIKVYDKDCALVSEGSAGFDNNAYIVSRLDKGEKYVIEVGGQANCKTGIYGLVVKKNEESSKASTWLRLNELTSGVVKNEGDVVHYKVIVPDTGRYLVNDYSDREISVDIYDKTKERVLPKGDCNFKLEGNSLYYIDVSAKDSDSVGVYNFKIENIAHAYKNVKCISDVNTGEITTKGQCDYYKFVPYTKDEYIITQGKEDKLVIDVFDRDGNIIALRPYINGTSRVMLDDRKLYHMRVRFKNFLDVGEYEFFVMSKSRLDEYKEQFLQIK